MQQPVPGAATRELHSAPRIHAASLRARRCVAASGTGGERSAPLAAAVDTLHRACVTKAVAVEEVVAALDQVEQNSGISLQIQGKHHLLGCPIRIRIAKPPRLLPRADFPSCIDGAWRLVFAVPAPIPSWAYIPVRENAIISVEEGTIVFWARYPSGSRVPAPSDARPTRVCTPWTSASPPPPSRLLGGSPGVAGSPLQRLTVSSSSTTKWRWRAPAARLAARR